MQCVFITAVPITKLFAGGGGVRCRIVGFGGNAHISDYTRRNHDAVFFDVTSVEFHEIPVEFGDWPYVMTLWVHLRWDIRLMKDDSWLYHYHLSGRD